MKIKSLIPVLVVLVVWQVVSFFGIMDPFILPSPISILLNLLDLLATFNFWKNLTITLSRVLVGLFIAMIFGTIIGIAIGYTKKGRFALRPLVLLTSPVPKIMLLPILVVILGIGEASRITLIFLAAVYPIIFNVWQGIDNIPLIRFEVARSLNLRKLQKLKHLILPSILSPLFSGIRISIGISLIVAFFAESFATDSGIGYFVIRGWELLQIKDIFSGIVVMSLLAFILIHIMSSVENKILEWGDTKNG